MTNPKSFSKVFYLLAVFIFSFSAQKTLAVFVDFDAKGKMNDVLGDLGVNKGELKYQIQSMNVSRYKKQQPQVSITFDPPNPAPGEKVTATATPLYFLNDESQMYFTWYLKTKNCNIDAPAYPNGTPRDWERRCDDDYDGESNEINDWKTRAARIIASNGFDWDPDGDGWPDQAIYEEDYDDHDEYEPITGGNDQKDKNAHCFFHNIASGNENEITGFHLDGPPAPCPDLFYVHDTNCSTGFGSHLFPIQPHRSRWLFNSGSMKKGYDLMCPPEYKIPSYDFDHVLEAFWHTNPRDPDTAETGNTDESNVAGLGINQFSWIYATGDKVGVVVEGVSLEPTQYADSSYKTMWALSQNVCDKEISAIHDLDHCLEQNLIDPQEGGSNKEKMDITLTYSPEHPVNDKNAGGDGDEVVVTAAITNATNPGYLFYEWEASKGSEMYGDSWADITGSLGLANSEIKGINLNPFKFKLNLSGLGNNQYIKVRLKVKENVTEFDSQFNESIVGRDGYAEVMIPVSNSAKRIQAAIAVASGNPPNLSVGLPICISGVEKVLCPVSKDQIIAVSIADGYTNRLWTVNGKPVQSINEQTTDRNTAFFPVLDDNGTQYNVTLTAINSDQTKVNISRSFIVTDPVVRFETDYNGNGTYDEAIRPVFMGYYRDMDGALTPDYSQTNFDALSENELKIKPVFTGFAPSDSGEIAWSVDGQNFLQKDNYYTFDGEWLTLPGKYTGDIYNVSVSYPYAPDLNTQKALYTYWGVNYADFYETSVSTSAKISLVDYLNSDVAQKPGNKKILASIYSGLPGYFAFLLRIVLTGFVILVVARFVYSYSEGRD